MITIYGSSGNRAVSAVFSDDHRYRYELAVELSVELRLFFEKDTVAFLLLNPSRAGGTDPSHPGQLLLDNTVTRCCGSAETWGYRRVVIANLFAWVSPHPEDLVEPGRDAVGPANDAYLRKLRESGSPIVCGWGAFPEARKRDRRVVEMLGGEFFCLGVTADGSPWHPLYLPADTPLQAWRPRA